MKKLLIILFIGLLRIGFGQYINASNITILPENPTFDDNIQIATIAGTPDDGEKIGLAYYKNDYSIRIIGCYSGGLSPSPKTYFDTVNVGTLYYGTYHVTFIANATFNSSCEASISYSDTIETDFTVGEVAVNELETQPVIIQLFPNPAKDEQHLIIQGNPFNFVNLQLLNAQGRLLKSHKKISNDAIILDIHELEKGVYFYKVNYGTSTQTIRFIKE